MNAVKIPEAIRGFLEKADFMSLATTDRNGQPSAANRFMLKIEEDRIYIVDFIRGKTWQNLQYNPFISLTVMDKENLRDYQINGTATVLESGEEYDSLMKELSDKEVRFATNCVIEGVQRIKTHDSLAFPFSRQPSIVKVKVDEIVEIGPTAELKKKNSIVVNDKDDFLSSVIHGRFKKRVNYYLTRHPKLTGLLSFFLVFGIGTIDYLTGYEIGVSSFYLIPIIMSTWGLNKKAGFSMALLSVASWIVCEILTRGTTLPIFIISWNASIRLTFFLIITQLLSSLKIRFEREQELSRQDYLTGVVNSRYFIELADRELKRTLREKKSFTLAYIDIDNFKQINDRFGHLGGDSLLKSVAVALKNATRRIDVVGRLGGDEFAILMPLTGFDGAQAVVSRLRRNIKNSMLEQKGKVTFSIGVVTFTEPPATVDEMISLADAQMYLAKKNGKNTVKHIIFDKMFHPRNIK